MHNCGQKSGYRCGNRCRTVVRPRSCGSHPSLPAETSEVHSQLLSAAGGELGEAAGPDRCPQGSFETTPPAPTFGVPTDKPCALPAAKIAHRRGIRPPAAGTLTPQLGDELTIHAVQLHVSIRDAREETRALVSGQW